MPTWFLARHAPAAADPTLALGAEDPPLSEEGRRAARALGARLAAADLRLVLTSDLCRAEETARLAAGAWADATGRPAPPVVVLPALRERRLGTAAGRPRAELRATGEMDALLGWTTAPHGGESLARVARRALRALAAHDGPGDRLVVAHAGVLRALLGVLDDDRAGAGRLRVAPAEPLARALPEGRWGALARAEGAPALVLASASPRRRALLRVAGLPVAAVRPADLDERALPAEDPAETALRLARDKARAVRAPGCLVLAADTVVHLDREVFPKPADDAAARAVLRRLSGRTHLVTTGWCARLDAPGGEERSGRTTTRVRFRRLSDATVEGYVRSGEWRDKAGGYGIQGVGAALVADLDGSYSNVVGLPLDDVLAALSAMGLDPEDEEAVP